MPLSIRTVGVGILWCCSALALAACGADREGGSAPADLDVPTPGLESPLGGGIALPERFPSDVPRYPGAELVSVNLHGPDMIVTFTSSSEVSEVAEHLEREFESRGWSTKSFTDAGGTSVWGDKQGRDADVLVSAVAGKTRLDYFVTP